MPCNNFHLQSISVKIIIQNNEMMSATDVNHKVQRNPKVIKFESQHLTLSRGMSFDFCTFISMTAFVLSANIPFNLRDSGNFPRYLPDNIKGHSNERSGIGKGYT